VRIRSDRSDLRRVKELNEKAVEDRQMKGEKGKVARQTRKARGERRPGTERRPIPSTLEHGRLKGTYD